MARHPGRRDRIVAKPAPNVLVLGMLTGRHPDKSAETLIHAGGPATDGRSSYDEIASARRKRDRQAPAQRGQRAE